VSTHEQAAEALPRGESDLVIRPLRHDDVERLYALFQALGPQSRFWFHPHAFDRRSAKELVEAAGDPAARRFLMIRTDAGEEAIVGYGFLMDLWQELPVLGVAIADQAQGQGLGERMVQYLIAVGRQLGKSGIQLTVYDDNTAARRLYERCGFSKQRIVHHMTLSFTRV
jgi:ribosomal protein S18 acetylase RimI-like enzyme